MNSSEINLLLGADALIGPPTGIGNYTRHLASELMLQNLVEDLRLSIHGRIQDFGAFMSDVAAEAPNIKGESTKPLRRFLPSDGRSADFVKKLAANRLAVWVYLKVLASQRRRASRPFSHTHIFHSPNYLLPDFDGPKVVTIHDLSTMLYPEFHPPVRVKLVNEMIARTIASDAHVIVDSPVVAAELARDTGISLERISVVALGVPSTFGGEFDMSVLDELGLTAGSYFLSVATVEPRKNISGICKAYALAKQRDPNLAPIVFVGGTGWRSSREHEDIEHLVQKGWAKYLRYVPDGHLCSLYRGAIALVFASFYEGFGLPVIEAHACGTRVITSKGTSMEPLAKPDDILVNPQNIPAIADAFLIASDAPARPEVKTGSDAVMVRSWGDVARDTRAVYASIQN